jgi:hypothetical protein
MILDDMKEERKKNRVIRSSSVEYLTFIAATGDGGVNAVYQDENIWLSQKMMGMLYNVNVRTINDHLQKIFSDSELQKDSVVRNFRITASDGKNYNTQHYNVSAIIAVGYKVNSERAVQFRKWATQIVQEFTIKGFAMDDERLKNDGTILGKKYFEEQLQRIREIRLSERKFYQKITDIYATAIDYDVTADTVLNDFSQRSKTNCIGLFMGKQQQRSSMKELTTRKKIWVYLIGKMHQMVKFKNLMYPLTKII